MSEYLALDWDDQQLLGLDAQVASESLHVRKCVRFDWKADARPSEHTEAAGKQLRAELDRAGIGATHVLVSLPREEAIVRLLELPECTDDELPELVRLQAATRSAVPLDRLLLDFLPLPRMAGVTGRRVLMVTLGKPAADRIQAVLTAAGLQATAIHLSAVGAAEVVAHQPRAVAENSELAADLIVSRSASRVEITAIARDQILFMHGATVSAHLPPEAIIAQILAETSRATVALSQAAPGTRIASGWIFGSTTELAGLPEAFRQRFGFDFQVLETPFATPSVRADFDAKGPQAQGAFPPLGILLAHASPRVASIDFLHPRQKVVKPDRRRLHQALAGAGAVVTVAAILGGIHLRVARLDDQIATLQSSNDTRRRNLEKSEPLMKTAKLIEDWTQRNVDWLEQFRQMETAIGGTDRLHFVSFNGEVAVMNSLATMTASGRAKSRHDVEAMNAKLAEAGYGPKPKEITPDEKNPAFPEKFELSVQINSLHPKEPAAEPSTDKSTAKSAAKPAASSESPARSATAKGASK
jgi:Tfp pilus assembly PilM family ATPase